ncbi:hypothetical protein HYT23_01095 [Candidatus Pacearchaeota archaeon]|nr:hypothetical protein [Candidatus Pacearchaeota archaeon]
MPITLVTALNQDSIAFVEVMNDFHLDAWARAFPGFCVEDISTIGDGRIKYRSRFYAVAEVEVCRSQDKAEITLSVNSNPGKAIKLFYLGQPDSSQYKPNSFIATTHSLERTGENSFDLHINRAFEGYLNTMKVYPLKALSGEVSDTTLTLKVGDDKSKEFNLDGRINSQIEAFAEEVIRRAIPTLQNHENFRVPRN